MSVSAAIADTLLRRVGSPLSQSTSCAPVASAEQRVPGRLLSSRLHAPASRRVCAISRRAVMN